MSLQVLAVASNTRNPKPDTLKIMLVSSFLVDFLLFGALLLGGVLDSFVPGLHGIASLLMVGAATYVAAQEASATLVRRKLWTQESLWTSVALCVVGFVYFWFRNQSDLVLLALSVGLMMASLMLAIAIISAVGAALREGGKAIAGFLMSAIGAVMLGVLAGFLILALGQPAASLPVVWKVVLIALSFVVWKLREKSLPTRDEAPEAEPATVAESAEIPAFVANIPGAKSPQPVAPTTHAHWTLIPQHGTILDRLGPAFLLAVLLIAFAFNTLSLTPPISSPAVAGTPISGIPAP